MLSRRGGQGQDEDALGEPWGCVVWTEARSELGLGSEGWTQPKAAVCRIAASPPEHSSWGWGFISFTLWKASLFRAAPGQRRVKSLIYVDHYKLDFY